MSILLQQEKVVSPREIIRTLEEAEERDARDTLRREHPLWRLLLWITRQP